MTTIFCPHCKLPMTELESKGGACPACDGSLRQPEPETVKAAPPPPVRSRALPWVSLLLLISLAFNLLWFLPGHSPRANELSRVETKPPIVVAHNTVKPAAILAQPKPPGLPYFEILPLPIREGEEEAVAKEMEPEPKAEPVKRAEPRAPGNLAVGKDGLALNGQVLANDPKYRVSSGIFSSVDYPSRMHTVDLAAGRRYRVKMEAAGDAVVTVRNKVGRTLSTVKAIAGVVDFPVDILADGPHRVVVALSRAGKYSLSIRDDEPLVVHDAVQDLRFNGQIGKTPTVTYMVKVTAGKNYQIDMHSPNTAALDPLVRVLDADGIQLAQDDDGAGNLNARLNWRAPATGIYRVVATRYQGHGPYTLTVRPR